MALGGAAVAAFATLGLIGYLSTSYIQKDGSAFGRFSINCTAPRARSFKIIDPYLENRRSEDWQRLLCVFDLLL